MRFCASSITARSCSAVAGVNAGTRTMPTSLSHRAETAGASQRARGMRRLTRFSSPARKTISATVEPSGPSSAARIFQSGAVRTLLPSIVSIRSPGLMPAFSAGEPGQRADDVGEPAAPRDDDSGADRPRRLLRARYAARSEAGT